jgi:hypothetical protein
LEGLIRMENSNYINNNKLLIRRIIRRVRKKFLEDKKRLGIDVDQRKEWENVLVDWEETLYREEGLELSMLDRKVGYWWVRGFFQGLVFWGLIWFIFFR